ncbi:hypothetical protein ACPPVQ_20090 [Diaminobutyricibacter sp. McL0618]|uniref:hypothetical protein n=1 Tax=Leifsonia sp. McL0618 TaxID=3415677 RepID=UPI003CFA77F1
MSWGDCTPGCAGDAPPTPHCATWSPQLPRAPGPTSPARTSWRSTTLTDEVTAAAGTRQRLSARVLQPALVDFLR